MSVITITGKALGSNSCEPKMTWDCKQTEISRLAKNSDLKQAKMLINSSKKKTEQQISHRTLATEISSQDGSD